MRRAGAVLALAAGAVVLTGCGGGGRANVPRDAIAYVGKNDDSGRVAVYVVGADGHGRERLTRETGLIGGLRWSPDGSRLALLNDFGVYVLNPDGSDLHRATPEEDEEGQDFYAEDYAWSPDGTRIAVTNQVGGAPGVIVVVSVEDGAVTPLVDVGESPTWSPDGRRIAYARCVGEIAENNRECDIWVVNADGSGARALVDGPTFDDDPAWSPDGRFVAFYRDVSDGDDVLGIADANRSHIRVPVRPPAWTYEARRHRVERTARPLVAPNCDLDWSPGGGRIVFQRPPCDYAPRPLWVARADGTGARKLADNAEQPRWRPAQAPS